MRKSRMNYNTNALLSSLKSDIPSMKKEATRLVKDAIRTEGTQQNAALKLGVGGERSLRLMLRVIEGKTDPPKPKAKKKKKVARKRKAKS